MKKEEMQRYKFLEDLGIKREDCGVNFEEVKPYLVKETKMYGLDRRVTYDPAYSLAQWLYNCLSLYREVAGEKIDLTQKWPLPNGGETVSLQEMLDLIIDPLEVYLVLHKLAERNNRAEIMAEEALHSAMNYWNSYFKYIDW